MWFPYAEEIDVPLAVADELEDLTTALRTASYRVRDALKTATFDVGTDGRPSNPEVLDAIRDATIAQMVFWAETGDATGAAVQVGGGSILSVSLPGGSGTTNARSKQDAREAPTVDEILRSCPGIDWAVQY